MIFYIQYIYFFNLFLSQPAEFFLLLYLWFRKHLNDVCPRSRWPQLRNQGVASRDHGLLDAYGRASYRANFF
jgi:hypothetical protein